MNNRKTFWLGIVAAAALAAVFSMFRKPLRYLFKRIMEKVAPDGEGREP
jgi:spore maturation protein SpmA